MKGNRQKKLKFYSQAGRKGLLRNQLVRYFCGKVNGRMTNEIKCVLSIKESNFNGKNGPKFLYLPTVRAKGADPPPLRPA